MKIKNFKQFVNESVVNELSGATMASAKDKRGADLTQDMQSLYTQSIGKELEKVRKSLGPIIEPLWAEATAFIKSQAKTSGLLGKECALVRTDTESNFGEQVVYLVFKGLFREINDKAISTEMCIGDNSLSFGRLDRGSESPAGFWVELGQFRTDLGPLLYVPTDKLQSTKKAFENAINAYKWLMECKQKLAKFAHHEGSQTLTPELAAALPKLESYMDKQTRQTERIRDLKDVPQHRARVDKTSRSDDPRHDSVGLPTLPSLFK